MFAFSITEVEFIPSLSRVSATLMPKPSRTSTRGVTESPSSYERQHQAACCYNQWQNCWNDGSFRGALHPISPPSLPPPHPPPIGPLFNVKHDPLSSRRSPLAILDVKSTLNGGGGGGEGRGLLNILCQFHCESGRCWMCVSTTFVTDCSYATVRACNSSDNKPQVSRLPDITVVYYPKRVSSSAWG